LTVVQAIDAINSVGEVSVLGHDRLRVRVPTEPRPPELVTALDVLRTRKVEALAILANQPESADWALRHLNRVAGARIVKRAGAFAITVWPERRGPERDLALKVLRLDHIPLLDRES